MLYLFLLAENVQIWINTFTNDSIRSEIQWHHLLLSFEGLWLISTIGQRRNLDFSKFLKMHRFCYAVTSTSADCRVTVYRRFLPWRRVVKFRQQGARMRTNIIAFNSSPACRRHHLILFSSKQKTTTKERRSMASTQIYRFLWWFSCAPLLIFLTNWIFFGEIEGQLLYFPVVLIFIDGRRSRC